MRALKLLILTISALLVLATGLASADITDVPMRDDGPRSVIDGDNYYSVTYRETNRYGQRVGAVIWHQFISGGKKRKIATLRAEHGIVAQLRAGGGRIAIGLQGVGPKIRSRIVVLNRDGSGKKVLIKGLARNPFSARSEDACDTFPWIEDVTSAGAVVLSNSTDKPRGKTCKPKTYVTHWEYFEIDSSGRRRTIESGQYTPGLTKSGDRWDYVDVEGDYIALVERKTLRVYLKNFATGVRIGPFSDSMRLSGRPLSGIRVDLAPNGLLAINSTYFEDVPVSGRTDTTKVIGESPSRWTDVFLNPLDRLTAARSQLVGEVSICGSRLMDFWWGPKEGEQAVRELDPATLNPIRTIAMVPKFEYIESCSATHLVVSRVSRERTLLRSVAIPN